MNGEERYRKLKGSTRIIMSQKVILKEINW